MNVEKLVDGIKTAFVDKTFESESTYKPQFISNNYKDGKKVLSSIEGELSNCDEFIISVAFITLSGLTPLLQTLKELEEKGIKGKILTTDYLSFSEPKALEKLSKLKNIELRMFCTDGTNEGFHTKGYIFKNKEIYTMIVGSSNMTSSALTINKEWNSKVVSSENGEYANEVLKEFNILWNAENTKSYDEIKDLYEEKYNIVKRQKEIAKAEEIISLNNYKLSPNIMQVNFIKKLKDLRKNGATRALLISATGTGKTYASAFAMRELGFKKVLFVVHRNQIAKQALKSYRKVFSGMTSMGLLTGNNHDIDSNFIFATIQTLSKEDILKNFSKDHFDAIVIDEAHHSSAPSYKRILDYFTPEFWLGMTATPDKRDDNIEGKNIYEIFDYKIACEIRLQDAMEEDLLCPFHYFGITDLEKISDEQKGKKVTVEYFKYLTSDERVKHIIKQANYYGYSGDRVKGFIFCSRVDEAKSLSNALNQRGFRTVALSGSDSEEYRRQMVERLAGDNGPDALDYILSVDIFSEGVDVPEINQVIMLRPTESPIVFVQQLGRGLRKAENKEYVVILDFIGNYNNNFMIPIALSGDRTYNKDNIRRYLAEGEKVIPGSSTVHFDEITRKKIYEAIDKANFNDIKLIKENYLNLKNKLGHIPALSDFDKYGEMDVLRIFDNKSCGSYYKFLEKYEKEYKIRLSEDEEKVIEFVSKKFASGKRIHELELLKQIITKKYNVISSLREVLKQKYNKDLTKNGIDNLVNIMTNEFPVSAAQKTYEKCILIEKENNDYKISKSFEKMLENKDFFDMLVEIIEFGVSRYQMNYSNTYKDTDFVLYQKYTYEDVFRLLQWEKNAVYLNIGGYKYDEKTNTYPIFINYEKGDNIAETIKFRDRFKNSPEYLIAISKGNRNLNSPDVKKFLESKRNNTKVLLFLRKNKNDKISKEFYCLGEMKYTGLSSEIVMEDKKTKAVEFEWKLDNPVREDLYDYIVNA